LVLQLARVEPRFDTFGFSIVGIAAFCAALRERFALD